MTCPALYVGNLKLSSEARDKENKEGRNEGKKKERRERKRENKSYATYLYRWRLNVSRVEQNCPVKIKHHLGKKPWAVGDQHPRLAGFYFKAWQFIRMYF
jgi:hypothetical protein